MSVKGTIWDPDKHISIRYTGLMDLDGFYKMLHDWFDARKFEWHEPNFKDKHPTSGDEQEVKVHCFRNDTEFLRVTYDLYFHSYELSNITVTRNGKKKKLEKGRFMIQINVQFEMDYENKFEGTRFQSTIRDFYIKYIFYRKMLTYGDKIEYEAHNLQEAIKQWFDMQARGNQFPDMW